MINIRFEEREKIGLQYALETLHGCSPFGQEKIRKLRYYSPDEREELETELYNVEQAAKAADALKPLYDRIGLMLCQMKDIRGSLRRCQALEIPDLQVVGAALVVAGGLGNAFDRFALGYVVDFIEPVFIDFPVFNVADIGVTCGFVLFLVGVIVSWRHEDRLSAELAASDGEGEGTDAR